MPQDIKYKIFDSQVKASDENDLTVEHFISTESLDRGGEIMKADGMRIKGKPVVLLQHGRSELGREPIAKPLWIKKGEYRRKKGIVAKTKFFDDEEGIGRRYWEKTKQGYMPNWSIGYQVLDYSDKKDVRIITEWDLLEYSLVAVPMNPDAQTIYKKSFDSLETVYEEVKDDDHDEENFLVSRFIIENAIGEDEEIDDIEEKPYPNEHACRLLSPDGWDRMRRQNDKFGDGIHAIFGVKNNTTQLQAIRFSKDKHTAAEARKWCKDHDHKCKPFEPAGKESKADDETDIEGLFEEVKSIRNIRAKLETLKKEIEDSITFQRPLDIEEKDLIEKIINILKKKGLIKQLSEEPVSDDKQDDKTQDETHRKVKLVIKQDDQNRQENTRQLARIIAEAFSKGFRQGINQLLGKVD